MSKYWGSKGRPNFPWQAIKHWSLKLQPKHLFCLREIQVGFSPLTISWEREREEKKNSQKMLNSSTMNHLLVHAQCNRANRYLFHDRLINIELAAKKQTNWVFAFHWLLFGFYRGGFKNRVSEKNLCIHHLRRIELKLYYYMAILYWQGLFSKFSGHWEASYPLRTTNAGTSLHINFLSKIHGKTSYYFKHVKHCVCVAHEQREI